MTAQVKEVIVDTNPIYLQHLSPNRCQSLFDSIAWRDELFFPVGSRMVGRGKCGLIDFAVRRQWQRVEDYEG